ncbi:hypothetical protein UlMin_012806 [Ulmus minor]
MDRLDSSEIDIDLESGEAETTTEEEGVEDSDSDGRHLKRMLNKLRSGHISYDESTFGTDRLGSSKNDSSFGENLDILVNGVGETAEYFGETKKKKEKHFKKIGFKKHPKPPRPPGRPLLDAADMKLVREISEHARVRRKRRERLKESKNLKANKAPSSSINLIAMLITIVFCFVVIFQGILGSRT